MKRMLLKEYKTIIPEQVTRPEPEKGEVLIKVSHVGICGSDISAFYGKHPYIPFPMVLGHEFTGYIAAAGPDTETFPVGSRVTVLPHLPCRSCEACAEKRYNHCRQLKCLGCQADGAQAEYVLAPSDMVFLLPESVSMEDGATIEPMAVSYAGVKKAVKQGDAVLIVGAGGIGLFALQAAIVLGAERVVIADFAENRLRAAKNLGAYDVIDLSKGSLAEQIDQYEKDRKFNVFVDCAGGNGSALDSIIQVADRGADVVCIGVLAKDCQIPQLPDLTEHELTFYGSNMYVAKDYDEVIQNLAEGKFRTEGVITHRFAFDQIPELYEMIDRKKEPYIKIMIEF